MKALKVIGIILAVLVGVIILLGLIAPKDYELKRSKVVNASPEVVYKNISTFGAFEKWNPFKKMDPEQTTKVEGTDGTVGAKYSWNGKKTGKGSMTTAKMEPNKSVDYDMAFQTPFGEMKSTSNMSVEPAEGGQKVTWEFKGRSPFPFNIMNLIGDMSKEMGPVFDQGLDSLKLMSESMSPATSFDIKEVDFAEKNCVAIRETVAFKDLSNFFATNMAKLADAMKKAGAKYAGNPLGVYYTWDEKAMKTDVAACLPYEAKKNFGKEFTDLKVPSGKAYMIDYVGPYAQMKSAYDAMGAKMKDLGHENDHMMVVEEYFNNPMTEKDSTKLHTGIYFLVNNTMAAK